MAKNTLISWFLTVGLAAGCTLSTPEPALVVVTSDAPPEVRTQIAQALVEQTAQALPSPVLTATPPPPPTATPTPTVPPAELLQRADRLRINGYAEQAIAFYAQASVSATETSVQAEALFRQGQSAVIEGLFEDALAPLTQLIGEYPDSARTPQAYFLRGDAYLGLSRWSEAVQDFETYLQLRPMLLDSYVHERIGDALVALGQRDAALARYELAVQANRSLVPLLALRERLAQIYLSGGQVAEAVAQYDAILAVAQNEAYRATIEYRAGQAFAAGGQQAESLARYQRVFDTYPNTAVAYDAMQQLIVGGADLSAYTRGVVAFNYGDYLGAIDAFNAHTTQVPLANVPPDLYLYMGRAYREIGNAAAADVAFRTIIDQYPQSSVFGEALLEQGRTLFLAGQVNEAIERYLQIEATYGYLTATAAEALWRAGYLLGTNNDPIRAAQIFERLANTYPDTTQANSGLFIGASGAYAAQDYATAERMYARLTVSAVGEEQATAFFWIGQIARQRGESDKATRAFQSAIEAAPDSYFAARAQDIVRGVSAFQPPSEYVFEFDTAAEREQADAWLRQAYGIEQEGALWQLSATLQNDARMIRGQELWQVGAYADAETEFFELINERGNARDGLASYQLAVYLREMGAFYPSIFAAANVITGANATTLTAPPYIARMRYPAYYADIIQEVSNRRQFDPLILLSLIRQESLFNTNATAAAGEKGLTQVIPSTGEYIATQIQWQDYQHADLFRPHAGIEFGAFYLAEQLQRFDGNVPAALAGYNAGPGRAGDWYRLSGGDPDLFMTTITINSTRQYVQLIYRNYNIYRTLYGR